MRYWTLLAIAASLMTTAATVRAQTSSTTTTTTIGSTTTTSTSLPPACNVAQTFASTLCRLDELAADVAGQAELGPFAPKLGKALDKARRNVNLGYQQCADSDARKASTRLKKAVRRLIQYGHRLRGLRARKLLADEIRTVYVERGAAIQQDLRAMKRGLVCPSSPSGAFL